LLTQTKNKTQFIRPNHLYFKHRMVLINAYRAYLKKNYGLETRDDPGFTDLFGRCEVWCYGKRGFVVFKKSDMYVATMEVHVIGAPSLMVNPEAHEALSALIRERGVALGYRKVIAIINTNNTLAIQAAGQMMFAPKSKVGSTDGNHEFLIVEREV
jgi:hypothetical protein